MISGTQTECYRLAQHAVADLKSALAMVLESSGSRGLTNSQIGRSLGIYQGHVGHEGHVPRTLLSLMATEGVVEQDLQSKRWRLRVHGEEPGSPDA